MSKEKDKKKKNAPGSEENASKKAAADAAETVNEKEQTAEETDNPEASAEPEKQEPTPAPAQNSDSKELEEEKNRFYRLYADFENYKKRTKAEKEGLYAMATADAVAAFLPAIDNLERALAVAEDSSLKKGVEMVLSQMQKALSTLNVEVYGKKGDTFDPKLHEAIMHTDEEGVEPDTVVEILQKGYKTSSKVIRHALVKVAN